MKTAAKRKGVNWVPLRDPIREEEVTLELNWSADERTRQAIERQAKAMGFESPDAYLHQLIAATLAGNEENTVIAKDGRIVCAHERL